MNRLWVRISILFAMIVLFVALFPIMLRWVNSGHPPFIPPQITGVSHPRGEIPPEISSARLDEIRGEIEFRTWTTIARDLLIAGLLGITGGLLISRWLVKPLQNLKEGAEAVANAKFTYRIPETGSLELQSVASSFNVMAERLETQEHLRQNLLADVTHELRHPVHLIQGNLQAILDGIYPLELKEIAALLDQTETLSRLVEDLHLLALAEASELPLHPQPVDLNSIVLATVDMLGFLATEKGLTLSTHLPSDPVVLYLDRDRFLMVLLNLLNNAVRFTNTGGRIQVSMENQPEQVVIHVQDDGIGISEEDLAHVFDRFYQADPSRDRRSGGSGLGMAIAQALVQAQGGQIIVSSEGFERGSTFSVLFSKNRSGEEMTGNEIKAALKS